MSSNITNYEINLEPSDVNFLETLKEGENSVVFKVVRRGQ
jgi:hypothetical protein